MVVCNIPIFFYALLAKKAIKVRTAIVVRNPEFLAGCDAGAAAFLANFGPFWLRVGVGLRLGLRLGLHQHHDPTAVEIAS